MAQIDPIQQQILALEEQICDEMQDLEMKIIVNRLIEKRQLEDDIPFLIANIDKLIKEGIDPDGIVFLLSQGLLKAVLGGNNQ